VRRAIEAHLGTRQVSRVIYGAIIGLALVVALQAHPPSSRAMVGSLAGTAIAVALAELYSNVLGAETQTRRRVGLREVASALDETLAVAFGVAFPALFFVLSALGAIEEHTAFTLAKWTGLGLIAFYGFCAGRLAGERLLPALAHGAVAGLVGAALIAVKALLH
jgi:VIT1/CCC1 family predicted Fe2+/Mn2+ transporter